MIDVVIFPRSSGNLTESDWYPSPDPPTVPGSRTLSGGTVITTISASTGISANLTLTSVAVIGNHFYTSTRFTRSVRFAPWLENAWSRVGELVKHPPDWDSYGGLPANPDVGSVVNMFLTGVARNTALREPMVDGLTDGGIQLEWYRAHRHLVVSFRPDLSITAYLYDSETGEEWAGSLPDDIAAVTARIAQTAL